jgi:hypothetical protein
MWTFIGLITLKTWVSNVCNYFYPYFMVGKNFCLQHGEHHMCSTHKCSEDLGTWILILTSYCISPL